MTPKSDQLTAAGAQALFLSRIDPSQSPTRGQVGLAIRESLRQHGGAEGCAIAAAGEYFDHPEVAGPRMQWALRTVGAMYARRTYRLTARLRLRSKTLTGIIS